MDWSTVDFGTIPDEIFALLTDSNIVVAALLVLATMEAVRIGKSVYKAVRK